MEEVIPLFLSIYFMNKDLKQTIYQLVSEQLLSEPTLFIVELIVASKAGKTKIQLILDGDQSITLEQCAKVSRQLGESLETQNLIAEAYILEVSSPGIEQPLKMQRQYQSRIGRKLKVELLDKTLKEGKLDKITAEEITLLPEIKNKKKAKAEDLLPIVIPFANIKQTHVLVSFN